MLIRNVKSRQDLENRKKIQAEVLQTQIENEALLEQRVSDYKNPNKPPPIPPQYMTISEILKDSLLQQREAIDNLRSINLDFAVASQVVQDLGKLRDGEANIIKLNKNFPFIKKDITEKLNVKRLDAQAVTEYLKEFFAEIDSAIGLNLAGTSSTNFFDKGARAGQSIIPTSNDYLQLADGLIAINQNFDLNTDELEQIMNRLRDLAKISPTENELNNIDTFDVVKRQRLNKQIQRLVQKPNYIPTITVLSQISSKIYSARDKGLPPVAAADALAQGFNVENIPTPPELQFALASLKKAIGIVSEKGIDALIDLKNDIGSELQSIEKIQEGLKRVDAPEDFLGDFPEPAALLTRLSAENKQLISDEQRRKKNYIQEKMLGLTETEYRKRITSPLLSDVYHNVFKIQVPTIDGAPPKPDNSNVIFEYVKKPKGNFELTEPPVDINGNPVDGVEDYLPNYLLKARLELYYVDEVVDGVETGKKILAAKAIVPNDKTTKNPEKLVFRYGEDFFRTVIGNTEIPGIYEKIETNPNFNPETNPADRVIQNQGFGLTDKVIKHFAKDNKEMLKLKKSYKKHMKTEKEADEVSSSDEEKEGGRLKHNGNSSNNKTFIGRRIKLGRGVAMKELPTYRVFGKYIVHYPQLINDNILNLKYPSTGAIPQIRPVNIDDNFKDFFVDVLDTGKINQKHFESLTDPEKTHFIKVAKGAKLTDVLKIKKDDKEDADMKRLELLFGEINAGNDNEKMLKECRELIKKFVSNGVISRNKGLEMLMELN